MTTPDDLEYLAVRHTALRVLLGMALGAAPVLIWALGGLLG